MPIHVLCRVLVLAGLMAVLGHVKAFAQAAEASAPSDAQAEEPPVDADAEPVVPGPIEVDEQVETAKAHFAVGKSLYDSGRFREAAAEWEQALEISGKPELAYNIYVAYRDASDLRRAIEALERYLESDVEPQLRINLQARLDAMRRSAEAQQAAEAAAAAPAPVEPEPVQPAPEPAPAPTAHVSTEDSAAPYVVMGVGGAMVVAGVVTGILANGKVDDIEAACPMDRCPSNYDLDGERDSARVFVTVTDVLLIGGIVTTGIGAVLALAGGSDDTDVPPAATGPSARVACGPDGCGVQVLGRF